MRSATRPLCGIGLLTLAVGLCACGGAAATDAVRESDWAPLTDRDPPPYRPPPADSPATGAPVGVATSGGYDQARSLALHVLEAIRDSDEAGLERMLGDPLGRVFPRLGTPNRPRTDVINQALRNPRRSAPDETMPLEQLVDVSSVRVVPLSHRESVETIPPGLSATDLLVTFTLSPRGGMFFRHLLGWPSQGGFVVRPGSEPQIVAL